MKNNKRLRIVYQNMLKYIQKSFKNDSSQLPTEVERKFIDILKTVIEGGYSINEKEFYNILEQIWFPFELTSREIKFFKAFMAYAKIKKLENEFTKVFDEEE